MNHAHRAIHGRGEIQFLIVRMMVDTNGSYSYSNHMKSYSIAFILLFVAAPALAEVDTVLNLNGSEIISSTDWECTTGWVVDDQAAYLEQYTQQPTRRDTILSPFIPIHIMYDSLLLEVDTYWWAYTYCDAGNQYARCQSWLYVEYDQSPVNPWYMLVECGYSSSDYEDTGYYDGTISYTIQDSIDSLRVSFIAKSSVWYIPGYSVLANLKWHIYQIRLLGFTSTGLHKTTWADIKYLLQ